jgi:hypothetical protein
MVESRCEDNFWDSRIFELCNLAVTSFLANFNVNYSQADSSRIAGISLHHSIRGVEFHISHPPIHRSLNLSSSPFASSTQLSSSLISHYATLPLLLHFSPTPSLLHSHTSSSCTIHSTPAHHSLSSKRMTSTSTFPKATGKTLTGMKPAITSVAVQSFTEDP